MRVTVALTKMYFPENEIPAEITDKLYDIGKQFDIACQNYFGMFYEENNYGLNKGVYLILTDKKNYKTTMIFDNMFTDFSLMVTQEKKMDFEKRLSLFFNKAEQEGIDMKDKGSSTVDMRIYSEFSIKM